MPTLSFRQDIPWRRGPWSCSTPTPTPWPLREKRNGTWAFSAHGLGAKKGTRLFRHTTSC